MDELYLTRGKRLDNGEWVQGYFALIDDVPVINIYTHIPPYINILPESAGRCTGFHDRNGMLIFEGDILADYSGLYIKGKVIWNKENLAWGVLTVGHRYYPLCCEENCEIVGNIHDNTTLYEGANNLDKTDLSAKG